MKIYLIKQKGKTYLVRQVVKECMCCIPLFKNKKSAKEYLDAFKHKDLLEIVSAEIEQSKKDNRRTKCKQK